MSASSPKPPATSIRGRVRDDLIHTSVDDARVNLRNLVAAAGLDATVMNPAQLRADLVATRDVLNARPGHKSRHAAFVAALRQLDRLTRKGATR
jgi:hypothetical protein